MSKRAKARHRKINRGLAYNAGESFTVGDTAFDPIPVDEYGKTWQQDDGSKLSNESLGEWLTRYRLI